MPLSSKLRFFVLRCSDESGEGTIVTRKNGTISFLQASNAKIMARRLAEESPGDRLYVVSSVSGFCIPEPELTEVDY